MAPLRSAANAISVAPRPGRRSTVKPRDSSSCEKISASRYDSPKGFDATTTGLAVWPRALDTSVITQSAASQSAVFLMIPAPPVLLARAQSVVRRIPSQAHEQDRAWLLSARSFPSASPRLPLPAGLLRRDRE